jgi:hypothetical protein
MTQPPQNPAGAGPASEPNDGPEIPGWGSNPPADTGTGASSGQPASGQAGAGYPSYSDAGASYNAPPVSKYGHDAGGYGAPQYGQIGQPTGAQQPQYGQPYGQPAYIHGGYGAQQPPPGLTPPPSNIGWAVAAILFFWPVAFSAWGAYDQVYRRWLAGDTLGAQAAAAHVKKLGEIALWVGIALCVVSLLLFPLLGLASMSTTPSRGY